MFLLNHSYAFFLTKFLLYNDRESRRNTQISSQILVQIFTAGHYTVSPLFK